MEKNREELLEKLEHKKMEFEQTLYRLIHDQREYNDQLSDDLSDESDYAQREVSTSGNYSLIERKSRELKDINRLIDRIHRNEKLGICEQCGRPIPAERLLIMPEATLCVSCKRGREKFAHMRKLHEQGFTGMGSSIPGQFESAEETNDDVDYQGFVSRTERADEGYGFIPAFENGESETQDSAEEMH